MADAPPEGRKARTRIVKASAASKTLATSDGPTILDAETFTHGGIPKAKFVPKVPQRRAKKLTAVKKEIGEKSEAELASELLKLVKQSKEDAGWRGPGIDRKAAPVQVAFGYGSSGAFGRPSPGFSRGGGGGGGGGGGSGGGFRGVDKKPSINDGIHGGMHIDDKTGERSKEYDDPMDYSTYYPMTLPLRKPYSGKSDFLDEEEFGEGLGNTYDENTIVAAQELGLWVCSLGSLIAANDHPYANESQEDKILFFQLPGSLPLGRLPFVKAENVNGTSSGANGKAVSWSDDKGASSAGAHSTINEEKSILEKLPAGLMGKLLVYESGAVKMKLGEILFDAVPGSECIFAQDVAAINSVTKQCCFLGNINNRVTLVPDVDSLLNNTVEIG